MMKLNLMREFIHLAQTKNYSKTAEELFITQSALSRHIVSLEEELNVKLIDRTRNSFALTAMGEITLDSFQKILEDYEHLLENLSRQIELERGELHVGFLYYDTDFYVSTIRKTFHEKFPQVSLVLHSYQMKELESALLNGKIDAAIMYGVSGCPRQDIRHLPFLKIPYSLFYHKDHRLSGIKDIHISDLNNEKLLCTEMDSELNLAGCTVNRMLADGGVHISERIEIHNYDEVRWMLEETRGICIAPGVNIHAWGADTECRVLLPELYSCDVSAVWLVQNKNPAIELLCSAIKMCYA